MFPYAHKYNIPCCANQICTLMVTSVASEEGLVNSSSTGHAYNNNNLIHHTYCVTQYFTLN